MADRLARSRSSGVAMDRLPDRRMWARHYDLLPMNDRLHREDGPAIEYDDGSKEWFRDGRRHRDDGPAWEGPDVPEWWVDGEFRRSARP